MNIRCLPIGVLVLFAGCYWDDRVPIEMASLQQTQPLGNEKTLDSRIRFDVGTLEITGKPSGPLYSFDLEYDKSSYNPESRYQDGRFFFSLEGSHRGGLRRQRHDNRMRLAFTEAVPLDLEVNTGVGEARLALSGLKVARVRLESGVGGAKISSYEPNAVRCESVRIKTGVGGLQAVGLGNLNFREFEFEGGVGGATLDFTGAWKQDADVTIEVGVGGVSVAMPREIGVRVSAEKHFLSGLHLENFTERGSYYYSENYNTAAVKVSLRIAAGIGGLKLTWI